MLKTFINLYKELKPKIFFRVCLKTLLEVAHCSLSKNKDFSCSNLMTLNYTSLKKIFNNKNKSFWENHCKKLLKLNLPSTAGGVNVGDRKAIFFLIKALSPKLVLEIGTHIGASSVHIAYALGTLNKSRIKFITVDSIDVNSKLEKPWLKYNSPDSPKNLLIKLKLNKIAKFVNLNSLRYLSHCNKKFDFIFLDGDHSAINVYNEIILALRLLKKNGVVLIHDYFPQLRPLWRNKAPIPGPFLAVQKLIRKNKNLKILPLGKLPWKTKFNSYNTSLAILTKNSQVEAHKIKRRVDKTGV